MSERDLIIILFLSLPLTLCAGVWLGVRIQQEQERIRAERTTVRLRMVGTDPYPVSHPKARNTFAPTPHPPHDEAPYHPIE